MTCPDENAIAAYFDLRLSTVETQALFAHVDQCDACARLFAEVAGSRASSDGGSVGDGPDAPASAPALATIGRYAVERMLGVGGMGVVYAAWDAQLERRVAIKLLRPDSRAAPDTLRARLVREAQAMAQLSHPNVINVYEVGTWGEQIFVVMELVDGETLAEWLRQEARGWREVRDVFLAAGAGLAAAHRAKIIHRDFKPENVLVSKEGRVCVTDFGLARRADELEPRSDDGLALASAASPVAPTLTRSGLLIGTPAYMAPEQLRGEPADERTDLFSFCVALYEALCGTRPFAGGSVEELERALSAGHIAPPRRLGAPGWLVRAVERGLRVDAAARPPTMEALLADLTRDPTRRRRRVLGGSLALGLLLACVVGGQHYLRRQRLVCKGAERKLAGVWDDARRAAVAAAFNNTRLAFAGDSLTRTATLLDGYARKWAGMHTEACEATRLRGEQSEELLDLRMQCLDERRDGLAALVALLVHADAKSVENGPRAAAALAPVEDCARTAALRSPLHPPTEPSRRARLDELRRQLAAATALHRVGRYADAEAALEPIVVAAQAFGYTPLLAEALLLRGQLEVQEDFTRSRKTLGDALAAAVQGHDDAAVARGLTYLVMASADVRQPGTVEDGHLWAQLAGAYFNRLGGDDVMRARLYNYEGVLYEVSSHYPEALAAHRHSIELQEKSGDSSRMGVSLNNIGMVLWGQGDRIGAAEYLERAVAAFEKSVGPMHASTAVSVYVLGSIDVELGRLERADRELHRALDIRQQLLGPNHFNTTTALAEVAHLRAEQERLDEAEALYRDAIARAGLTPFSIFMQEELAEVLEHRGKHAEAMAMIERAMPIADNPINRAKVLRQRALLLLAHGQTAPALADAQAAVAMLDKSDPPQEKRLADALVVLGKVHLAGHAAAAALPPLERALKLITGGVPESVAEAQLTLARALVAGGGDGTRARALATEAAQTFATLGPAGMRQAEAARAWLATRPPIR